MIQAVRAFTLAVFGFVIVAYLFNYDMNWTNPEFSKMNIPNAMMTGHAYTWKDVARSFDFMSFDFVPRARFLSHFFEIINIKLRVFLFQFLPPHPSFSITWIVTLILSPLFLYRLVLLWTGNTVRAWTSLALYVCSTGYLSSMVMLFHPAKTLAHFFIIFSLYLGAKVDRESETKRKRILFISLCVFLFFGCFMDETVWFAFPSVLVMSNLLSFRKSVQLIGTFILFLFSAIFVAPHIVSSLGFGVFDYWGYAFKNGPGLSALRLDQILQNLYYLLSSHLYLFDPAHVRPSGTFIAVFLAMLLGSGWMYYRLERKEKLLPVKLMIVLIGFLVFHSLIMSKYPNMMEEGRSCYYYGSLFSLIFSLWISSLIKLEKHPVQGLGVIFLIGMSLVNFPRINHYWVSFHDRFWQGYFSIETQGMPVEGKISYLMIKKAWEVRHKPEELEKIKKTFPRRGQWLFAELPFIK